MLVGVLLLLVEIRKHRSEELPELFHVRSRHLLVLASSRDKDFHDAWGDRLDDRSEGIPEFYISVERRIVDLQLEIGFRTVVIRTGSTEGERTASQERARGHPPPRLPYTFLTITNQLFHLL